MKIRAIFFNIPKPSSPPSFLFGAGPSLSSNSSSAKSLFTFHYLLAGYVMIVKVSCSITENR